LRELAGRDLPARMMRIAYLMEMTMIRDQKINDTIPMTASGDKAPPGLAAFTATCGCHTP